MKLYKFYTVNKNSISSLVNKFVWFSSPNDFNDPFDTALIDNDYLRSINFNNEKIFCLTKSYDNFLMWSHYAESHRGFCIEFEDYTDEELEELKSKKIFPKDAPNEKLAIIRNAKPVQYKSTEEIEEFVKNIPLKETDFMEYYNSLKTIEEKNNLISKIQHTSFIKHLDWKYEKELRIINIKKNINYPPGKISAIYFGVKMSSVDKRCIGMIVSPTFKECELYQMYRVKGEFKLKYRPFEPSKDLEGFEGLF
jgi:hypothetical protein